MMNKPLALVLGFRQEGTHNLPVTSANKIDVHAGFNNLFMYVSGLVKETMVGDAMAPFLGNVTPVFDHEVYIVEPPPPIVMYAPIMEDLPYEDSIRLDLLDELGKALAWDRTPFRNHRPHFTLEPGSKHGLQDHHFSQ